MDRPAVPIERLRELLVARVEASSIRSVAKDVGLPPNGLSYFLEGGSPRTATVRKLEAWYVREAARAEGQLSAEAGRAALSILLRYVPPAARKGARARMTTLLEVLCREADVPAPEWARFPNEDNGSE
jgi:hypothetical protein